MLAFTIKAPLKVVLLTVVAGVQVSGIGYLSGKRRTVAAHALNLNAASTSLDPDDYELFEDAYDSDDYEEVCLHSILLCSQECSSTT